jgi:hypothetical protein
MIGIEPDSRNMLKISLWNVVFFFARASRSADSEDFRKYGETAVPEVTRPMLQQAAEPRLPQNQVELWRNPKVLESDIKELSCTGVLEPGGPDVTNFINYDFPFDTLGWYSDDFGVVEAHAETRAPAHRKGMRSTK